jgi:hypothetical protein
MLFHGEWKIGAAFDRRVVGDNHARGSLYDAHASDQTSPGTHTVIKVGRRKLREFEKSRPWVE